MAEHFDGDRDIALSAKSDLAQLQSGTEISPAASQMMSERLHNISLEHKVLQDISTWTEKQRETTRSRLVMWLAKLLGYSLLGTFLLVGVLSFSPKADKDLVKNLVPQLITTQITLLGVAFGFYFGNKED